MKNYMIALINRVLMCVICFVSMWDLKNDIGKVVVVLCMVIVVSLGQYFSDQRLMCIVLAGYCSLMYVRQGFVYAAPVVIYELTNVIWNTVMSEKDVKRNVMLLAASLWCVTAMAAGAVSIVSSGSLTEPGRAAFIELLCVVIAVLLDLYGNMYMRISHVLIETKDNSRELNLALKAKNMYLIEQQNSQIYTATLKERNRIAREIHDNVGHMLSRSIIQTGAAIAVNQQENLVPVLTGVKETLDSAMNSIRSSVHDLHDESIDLEHNITDIINGMEGYHVDFEYDMTGDIPRSVKYCIISIVKEAASNVVKHSDADHVEIVLREHPAFYQMMIRDNGKCIQAGDGTGIGIENMKERVSAFQGQIQISTKNGYRIFVNIPKDGTKT